MAFLNVEGLDISVSVEGVEVEDVSVEQYSRVMDDSYEGLTYSPKKSYSFTTPPMTAADARAVEGWIRGRRHYWSFDSGIGPSTATTYFTNNSVDLGLTLSGGTLFADPHVGTWAKLYRSSTSGTSGSFTARFGSEGDWTVHFYHKPFSAASYTSYVVRSLAGTITAFANAVSTTTVRCMSVTASSGSLFVVLGGKEADTGTASTSLFDCVTAAPYAYTTEMIEAVSATQVSALQRNGHFRPPYVRCHGDILECGGSSPTFGNGPVFAKGFVRSASVAPLVINGTLVPARQLQVTLVEK